LLNLLENIGKNVSSQNEIELKSYFHVDAFIPGHNTNELFTVSEFIRANCEYPGNWNGEVERIELAGNTVITVTRVWTNGMSFHATSFFEITEGKIKTLDEYWGDDGEVPQWRKDMSIGKPIS